MRNYIKFGMAYFNVSDTGEFLSAIFANDAQEALDIANASSSGFPYDVDVVGPFEGWLNMGNKAFILGLLNAAQPHIGSPGSFIREIEFDESLRDSGFNSETEKV